MKVFIICNWFYIKYHYFLILARKLNNKSIYIHVNLIQIPIRQYIYSTLFSFLSFHKLNNFQLWLDLVGRSNQHFNIPINISTLPSAFLRITLFQWSDPPTRSQLLFGLNGHSIFSNQIESNWIPNLLHTLFNTMVNNSWYL